MAYPKSVSETVNRIQNKLKEDKQISATLNWDVVVNYSVDSINKLLKKTSTKQIKEIKFEVAAYDDRKDEFYTLKYALGLGAPFMEFNPRGARGPSCNLSIPIVGGTVKVDGSQDSAVPSDVYTLILSNLILATAKGFEGSLDYHTQHHSEQFYFSEETKEGFVVIDLPSSDQLTVIVKKSSAPSAIRSIDQHIPDMEKSIAKMFLDDNGVYKKHAYYEIARVNSSGGQLKPKSFKFDTFLPSETPSENNVGVLTLFIQTRATLGKIPSELSIGWEYQWRTTLECSPIPIGKTASIIFSKEMIYECLIKPAVKEAKWTEGRTDDGYCIKMKIDPKEKLHRDRESSRDGLDFHAVQPIDVTLLPFYVELTERDSSGASKGGSVITWDDFVYTYEFSTREYGGIVKVTNKFKKDKFNEASLDDHHLMLDFSVISSDWDVYQEPQEPGLLARLGGALAQLPKWTVNLPQFPELKLTLADVNFFLTTNLLFPDDKLVINIDKVSGVHIPGDFYLVGDVVDHLK